MPDIGGFQRESADTEPVGSRGFGEFLRGDSITSRAADFAAVRHPYFPAIMVENHSQTGRTAFYGIQLEQDGHATPPQTQNKTPDHEGYDEGPNVPIHCGQRSPNL